MPLQVWQSLQNTGAPWQTASGTVLNTAATATISPEGAGGTGADPLVYTFYEGQVFRVSARGIYTCGSTATNLTVALWASISGTALSGGTSLATTGAFAMPVSQTNLYWDLDAHIQIRAMAQGTSTATVYTHGKMLIQSAAFESTLTNSNHQIVPLPATAGPTAADLDTTITHTIGLVGTLSQSTGSPAITCTMFMLEPMN
jgi:hypothetical protein